MTTRTRGAVWRVIFCALAAAAAILVPFTAHAFHTTRDPSPPPTLPPTTAPDEPDQVSDPLVELLVESYRRERQREAGPDTTTAEGSRR